MIFLIKNLKEETENFSDESVYQFNNLSSDDMHALIKLICCMREAKQSSEFFRSDVFPTLVKTAFDDSLNFPVTLRKCIVKYSHSKK